MPKELLEIRQFKGGVVSAVSEQDVTPETAVTSLNVDPLNHLGHIHGIPVDDTESSTYAGDFLAEIRGGCLIKEADAKYRALLYDVGTRDVAVIGDSTTAGEFYGDTPVFNAKIGSDITSTENRAACQEINGIVHMGFGSDPADIPQWYGKHRGGNRFGPGAEVITEEYSLADAEVSAPDSNFLYSDGDPDRWYAGGNLPDSLKYFFAYSVLYDDIHESNLVHLMNSEGGETQGTFDITSNTAIAIYPRCVWAGFSERISKVYFYAATSTDLASDTPETLYRKIGILDLYKETSPGWGVYADRSTGQVICTDFGETYESSSGQTESMDSNLVHWRVGTQLNNYHFVAGCYNPSLPDEDWSRYLVRSAPFQYGVFNWVEDILRLPQPPTAIAAFRGRVYVFSESKVFRVEPELLFVEEVYEGQGCSGPDAVLATEYGLFFSDANNLWMHDGRAPQPIGDAVKLSLDDGTFVGWQELVAGKTVHASYDGKRTSVLFMVEGVNKIFAYTIAQERWDVWDADDYTTLMVGKNSEPIGFYGENIGSQNGQITRGNLLRGATNRSWSWTSPKMTLGEPTNKKYFHAIRAYYEDNSGLVTKEYATDSRAMAAGNGVMDPDSRKSLWVQVKVSGTLDSYLESIGITFRRKVKRLKLSVPAVALVSETPDVIVPSVSSPIQVRAWTEASVITPRIRPIYIFPSITTGGLSAEVAEETAGVVTPFVDEGVGLAAAIMEETAAVTNPTVVPG